jgi:hypothetical protein
MTNHIHRLIVVIPAAQFAAVGQWWQSVIDPADDLSTWPALSPTGQLPETHRCGNMAFVPQQLRSTVAKVCQLAGITPPALATWNGWTPIQQRAWLTATRNQFYDQTGIWLDLADNTGDWDDPVGIFANLGLVPLLFNSASA